MSETERKNTILFEKGIYGIGKHTQDIHIHKQVYKHSQNTKTNTHTHNTYRYTRAQEVLVRALEFLCLSCFLFWKGQKELAGPYKRSRSLRADSIKNFICKLKWIKIKKLLNRPVHKLFMLNFSNKKFYK